MDKEPHPNILLQPKAEGGSCMFSSCRGPFYSEKKTRRTFLFTSYILMHEKLQSTPISSLIQL